MRDDIRERRHGTCEQEEQWLRFIAHAQRPRHGSQQMAEGTWRKCRHNNNTDGRVEARFLHLIIGPRLLFSLSCRVSNNNKRASGSFLTFLQEDVTLTCPTKLHTLLMSSTLNTSHEGNDKKKRFFNLPDDRLRQELLVR